MKTVTVCQTVYANIDKSVDESRWLLIYLVFVLIKI